MYMLVISSPGRFVSVVKVDRSTIAFPSFFDFLSLLLICIFVSIMLRSVGYEVLTLSPEAAEAAEAILERIVKVVQQQ